jgi:hypothetical protein
VSRAAPTYIRVCAPIHVRRYTHIRARTHARAYVCPTNRGRNGCIHGWACLPNLSRPGPERNRRRDVRPLPSQTSGADRHGQLETGAGMSVRSRGPGPPALSGLDLSASPSLHPPAGILKGPPDAAASESPARGFDPGRRPRLTRRRRPRRPQSFSGRGATRITGSDRRGPPGIGAGARSRRQCRAAGHGDSVRVGSAGIMALLGRRLGASESLGCESAGRPERPLKCKHT